MSIKFTNSKIHRNHVVVKDPEGTANVEFAAGNDIHSNDVVVDASTEPTSQSKAKTLEPARAWEFVKSVDLRTQVIAGTIVGLILIAVTYALTQRTDPEGSSSEPAIELQKSSLQSER